MPRPALAIAVLVFTAALSPVEGLDGVETVVPESVNMEEPKVSLAETHGTNGAKHSSDCSKRTFTITDKKHVPPLHASGHCLSWEPDESRPAVCNKASFPMTCTFTFKKTPNAKADRLIQAHLAGLTNAKDPTEIHQADVDDVDDVDELDEDDHDELFQDLDQDLVDPNLFLLDEQGKRVKGKRDDQYMWAAKAIAKAEIHGDTCKPPTNGKRAPRGIDCDACWWGFVPHPCNCNCRGWTQIGPICVQPCHEHGEYTHDSGLYCHKPCNREGQLALRTGCGLGHDRVCTDGTGGCLNRHLNRIWAAFDVAAFIVSLGSSSAITVSMKTAKTVGLKAGLKALKSSLKASAKKLAKKVMTKGWIKKQLKGHAKSTQESIMESGATLLLASNLPTDWGSVALEIASAVDPTGVIGFASGFVPPKSCDEAVYFKEPLPPATSGPDEGPLDGDMSRWNNLPGIPYVDSLVNNADDSGETVYYSEKEVKSYCDQTAACLGYYAAANKAYWRGLHAGQRVNFWYTGNHGFTVRKKPPPPTYVNSLVNNADDSGETVYHSEAQVKSYCDQTAACLGYYAAANNAYWRGLHAGHRVNFWYTGNHGFTVRKKTTKGAGDCAQPSECPPSMPKRYPGTNRCFQRIWGGNMCNVDPTNDPVAHHRGDKKCICG